MVAELARLDPEETRRIREVRTALQKQNDDLDNFLIRIQCVVHFAIPVISLISCSRLLHDFTLKFLRRICNEVVCRRVCRARCLSAAGQPAAAQKAIQIDPISQLRKPCCNQRLLCRIQCILRG